MTIAWLGGIGILFLGFGVLILSLSNNLVEIKLRYDDQCGNSATCNINFNLPSSVNAPVYFYYMLTNFNQNLRQLFDSKSYSQLAGADLAASSLSSCGPVILNQNLNTQQSIGNNFLDPNAVAYPCGGLAKAYFNGSLRVTKTTSNC